MLIIDLSSVFCLIVFAHITESRIYLLRVYDEEPLFIDANTKAYHTEPQHSKVIKALANTVKIKPKRNRNNQAIIHYGRHIYHLDSFDDINKLRSELFPDYVSYDYFDMDDLIRSTATRAYIPLDYIENLMDISSSPLKLCKGRQCVEDHRKYSDTIKKLKRRRKRKEIPIKKIWNQNKFPARTLKRFKIVDNRNKLKAIRIPKKEKEVTYDSTEGYREKKKLQAKHRHKKELSSESVSTSDSKESEDSSAESLEIWQVKKNVYDSDSKSTEESMESTEKPKKTYITVSDSNSSEDKSEIEFSNSIEDRPKKKRKQPVYASSEEMRKKFEDQEDLFLQGNKLYNTNSVTDSMDSRRRLPQFLPKRFHWDPSDIHELGYYWFNGPKGRYPAPQVLL